MVLLLLLLLLLPPPLPGLRGPLLPPLRGLVAPPSAARGEAGGAEAALLLLLLLVVVVRRRLTSDAACRWPVASAASTSALELDNRLAASAVNDTAEGRGRRCHRRDRLFDGASASSSSSTASS
jgi:hypothetical protein